MKLLQVERTDDLYQTLHQGPRESFCERLLESLGVDVEWSEADLQRIPKTGAVLAVANHPFGIVEGVALAKMLPQVRPDVKIMANQVLAQLPELDGRIIAVDPMGGVEARRANLRGMREALEWLQRGSMLLVFPAGEVSQLRFEFPRVEVVDPVWNDSIARLVRRSNARVLPIFIEGRNSALFQLAGLVHPRLRTALLPHELLNKQRSRIAMRFGAPIEPERMQRVEGDAELMRYLRWRTYLLGRQDRVKRSTVRSGRPIAPAMPKQSLLRELRRDPLIEAGDLQVFSALGTEIPAVLREIGRLREITFRAVGEGTGKAADLDRFDENYHHLFLWNRVKQEIAGAYRLGLVDELVATGGLDRLYTRTLFQFDERFLNQIGPSIELGRSFIHPEYQRGFQPLLLLWKGIGRFVLEHAPAHVLFGPVSVSADYGRVSRELIASVLGQQNGNPALAGLVKARRPLRMTGDALCTDLEELGQLVGEIEGDGKSIPVLLRQYLKLGGQLLSFNVDPKFGNCLDGLIVVDLARTDLKLLDRYMGADGARQFLNQNRERGFGLGSALHPAVQRVALDRFPPGFTN